MKIGRAGKPSSFFEQGGRATSNTSNGDGETHVPDPGPAVVDVSDLGGDQLGAFGRYWLGLAERAGGIPAREDFNPADLPQLLPNLIVLENVGGGDFLYRLLGTGVDLFTKRNYTGLRTSEIPGHGPGNRIYALYTETLRAGALMGCTLPYVGHSTVCRSVRQIAAPFRGSDGSGDQIVSLIEFDLVVDVLANRLPPEKRSVL